MEIDRGMPDLDAMYRDVVLDHFRNPRGRKPVAEPTACSEGQNPVCGDQCKLCVRVADGKIADVGVQGRGCAISTASGSMMAELLPGKSLPEAQRLVATFKGLMHGEAPPIDVDLGDLDALEGVKKFPVRVKCALLAWTTFEDLVKNLPAGSAEAPKPAEAAPAAAAGTPPPTKEAVLDAIKPVMDPEISLSVVDLGMIYGVEVDAAGMAVVRMTLTSPACPYGPELIRRVAEAARSVPGVKDSKVDLVWEPKWDPKTMASDLAKDVLGIW